MSQPDDCQPWVKHVATVWNKHSCVCVCVCVCVCGTDFLKFCFSILLTKVIWKAEVSSLFVTVKKVKWSRYRPGVAQRVGRGIALPFHDRGTRRRWVVSWRLGGPQGRSARSENLVPTGIRSRTVQPRSQSLYRLSYPMCKGKRYKVHPRTGHDGPEGK